MSAPSSRRGCQQIPSGGPKPGCLDDEHDVTPQRLPKDSWVGSHSTNKNLLCQDIRLKKFPKDHKMLHKKIRLFQ